MIFSLVSDIIWFIRLTQSALFMKTIIYFIRHGQVYNPKNIIYGRLPGFFLSSEGKKKIEEVAEELKKKGINHLYTSPMLRARQTAQILGKSWNLVPRVSSLLIETNLIVAGIPLDVFKSEIQPKIYDTQFISKGQESIDLQAERMLRFVSLMERRHSGKTIAAVSHGDPLMILKASILGEKFTFEYKKKHYLKPGCWYCLQIENGKYILPG